MLLIRLPLRTLLLASTVALLSGGIAPAAAAAAVPRPDHVVVVVMENHSNTDVIGNPSAPYINSLADNGANFSQSYGITHPSQPNYLALFSGSTQAVTDNSCPHTFTSPNLASELIASSLTFAGYSESMPSDGYTGCASGPYARKHNPWVNFSNVPVASNLTLSSFPTDYNLLPTVSIVVPNQDNDMHDGTVAQGDAWLQQHIDGYLQWAQTHNSLLVLTWDEDDNNANNRIPTVFAGPLVKPGVYSETINHYNVLRTLEDAYGLPYAGASAAATPITDVWGAGVPTGPGCTPTQLLVNSGFETGTASPWTGSTDVVVRETTAQRAYGGSWLAWLGGKAVARTDTLSQTVSIPTGCRASLSFWLHIDTAEQTRRTGYDTLSATLESPSGAVLATLATYSNLDAAAGYQLRTFDVSQYAGSQLTVTFTATENSAGQTSFVLDHTGLAVS
ncbi:MAG: phosphatidylinositol-3-phosphatase [Pseudonocardiales bacterium]|nr:phosphatidylinositol-3-phosphatase [Pseudonocardiales bacterium]